MATIFKRTLSGGNWTWVIQWRTETGRLKTRHLGKMDKQSRETIKARIELDLVKKKFGVFDFSRKTVNDLFQFYLEQTSAEKAPATIKRIKEIMRQFSAGHGETSISRISPEALRLWRSERSSSGLANTTINIEHRHLKAIFNFAVTSGWIQSSPFDELKLMRIEHKLPPIMRFEDVKKFFAVIDHQADKAFFLFLYYTGCRPAEAWQLRWENIDLETEVARLTKTKGHKDRLVALHKTLVVALSSLQSDRSGKVFPYINDKFRPNKLMKKYLRKASLPENISPKFLRHTFSTTAISKSKDAMGVKDILGHSSLSVTQIYTHLDTDNQRAIINQIPNPLGE